MHAPLERRAFVKQVADQWVETVSRTQINNEVWIPQVSIYNALIHAAYGTVRSDDKTHCYLPANTNSNFAVVNVVMVIQGVFIFYEFERFLQFHEFIRISILHMNSKNCKKNSSYSRIKKPSDNPKLWVHWYCFNSR